MVLWDFSSVVVSLVGKIEIELTMGVILEEIICEISCIYQDAIKMEPPEWITTCICALKRGPEDFEKRMLIG